MAKDFLTGNHRIYGLWGSVSSGKTVTSAEVWAALCEKTPMNYPLAMIGKTERTLEANVLDPLADFLGPKRFRFNRNGIAHIYDRKIRIYGANDQKAESKIRGKTLYAWYGDEVTTWPESFFMMALSRLRIPGAKAIMTMNPEGPYHWYHKQVIERAQTPQIKAKLYHFVMDDNPHLDQEYKDWISSMYVPGTVWHKRWVQGIWATAEGAIFPFLSTDLKDGFVINELPDDLTTWLVAADYGLQHPTVYVLAGYSQALNRWIVIKEFFTNDKTNVVYSQEFKREILDFNGGIRVIEVNVDSGGGGLSLIKQLQCDYPNLAISSAIKKDVNKELQDLASALFTHRVCLYSPGCPKGLEQLTNYTWDDKAKQRGKDEPLKANDDFCDALRYLWQLCLRYS